MIRKDRGNHDESLPVQKSLDIHWRTLSDALLHITGVPEAACMTEASSLNFYYVKTMAEVQEASPGIGHLFNNPKALKINIKESISYQILIVYLKWCDSRG